MELVYQLAMGLSLAACAGFRATLPLLIAGIMAKCGQITLNPSLAFLSADSTLIILGIATVFEFFGDKIIGMDHFMDVVGTIARPVAGTLLASSMLTHVNLPTALFLGLIVGGGAALTTHAGKSVVRAKSTLTSMFHFGAGNAALSCGEDVFTLCGSFLAIFFPIIAMFFAFMAMGIALILVFVAYKAGKRIFAHFSNSKNKAISENASVAAHASGRVIAMEAQ